MVKDLGGIKSSERMKPFKEDYNLSSQRAVNLVPFSFRH